MNWNTIKLLFIIAGVCDYIVSITNFVGSHNYSMGVLYLCMGTVFIIIGMRYGNKDK